MRFDRFMSSFRCEPARTGIRSWAPKGLEVDGFADLMGRAAGCRFEQGLYRLHDARGAARADELVAKAFPEFARRSRCFGVDWLGRQFALDVGRVEDSEPLVLMLEPGTGEALEIPASFVSFHDEELVDFANEALAREFFEQWAEVNSMLLPLAAGHCVGYRVPLFLGGTDDVSNLELIDLDVYWTLCGQLRHGVRRMPAGTTIGQLTIS
ncbi:MAG: DUF1851 domain-containing protein [Actinomycetota bacterium]|nr:DUF1851 domain-containing protein [Actinomycetota bacterium]